MTDRERLSRAAAARWIASIIVTLEAVGAAVLFGYSVFGFVTRGDDPFLPALSIVLVAGIAFVWVAATAAGLLRRRSWARGSALTVQMLLFTVGIGAFQGLFAQPSLGWALVLPAVAGGIAAVLSKPGDPAAAQS